MMDKCQADIEEYNKRFGPSPLRNAYDALWTAEAMEETRHRMMGRYLPEYRDPGELHAAEAMRLERIEQLRQPPDIVGPAAFQIDGQAVCIDLGSSQSLDLHRFRLRELQDLTGRSLEWLMMNNPHVYAAVLLYRSERARF